MTLIVLFASCILGTLFILLSNQNGAAENANPGQEKVFSLSADDIAEFVIENEHGESHFTLNQKHSSVRIWEINGESRLDSGGDELLGVLSDMTIKRSIPSDEETLKEYGLQKPKTSVRLVSNEDEEVKFFFGNKTPTGYYLKKECDPTIYIVGNAASSIIHFSIDDFAKQRPFHVNLVNIEQLDYRSKSHQFTIKRFEEKKDQNFNDYYFVKPFSTKPQLDISNVEFTELIDFVNMSIPVKSQETTLDLDKLGLSDPNLTIYIKTIDGNEKQVVIGNETSTGSSVYYAKIDSSDFVYELRVEKPDQVFNIVPAKLAIQAPLYAFITKVKLMEITHLDKIYSISINKDADDFYYINEQKMDKQLIKDLYLLLLELKADTDIDEELVVGEKNDQVLTVKVTYADGDVSEVSYQDYDDQFYSIIQQGNIDFVIAKEKFTKIFESISTIDGHME